MKLGNKTAKVAPFSESSRSLAFWILPKLHEHWNLIAKIKLKLLNERVLYLYLYIYLYIYISIYIYIYMIYIYL